MDGVTMDKPQSVDELSSLFDEINVGSNLDVEKPSDYGSSETETLRPFADKVADVKAIMKPEPDIENKIPKSDSVCDAENKLDVVVDSHPKKIVLETPVTNQKSQVESLKPIDKDNPLELNGEDFRAYTLIKEKYPQFQIPKDDYTQAFQEFYRYKVRSLKSLLTRYGVLPLNDMKEEIENLTLDKRLGVDLADPVVIGQQMDNSIANRGRVASLLSRAQVQLPAWKKTFEWLNSKVWKDHESKGAHKRDSLALEHNSDMKDYYSELQGFVDAATTIDSFLKSQHDSYSRQLSCVDIREKVGMAHDIIVSEIEEVSQKKDPPPKCILSSLNDGELDGLDTLESGTVISRVPVGGLVERDFPGSEIESEFLDGVG